MSLKGRLFGSLLAFSGMLVLAMPAQAAIIYADDVIAIDMGNAALSQFPGSFYGGNFPGAFPVPLTPAEAEAAVLGAPDGFFLSLQGEPGNFLDDAFVAVSFDSFSSFDPTRTSLLIRELGNNQETATIYLVGSDDFAFFDFTRGVGDDLVFELSAYAFIGQLQFVIIEGRDQLGASWGWDLDSVGLQVPEPGSLALLGLGLAGLGLIRRRRIV